ncbi:MAG: epoxyqueuosine reductase QueH, partial [Erysipelotrichales bacterium]|nr:epoxyqueuosine reductase QueH [Erysipelotrichales bacterium]
MNYFELGKKDLQQVSKINQVLGRKQKLLIHACCAPCSTFPIEYLQQYFHITLYYTNSNIYPESEYQIRLHELVQYVEKLQGEGVEIDLVIPEYDNKEYTIWLSPRKNMREGQEACFACYKRRLEDTFRYAVEHHYEYVSTVMSISRQKNSRVLNELGDELSKVYPTVKFLHADFKKKGGQ